jgi:hypothetical protein
VRKWLLAAAVGAGAFALFTWASPVSPVVDDAARDLLLVRDCVELGTCHTMGPPTSVPGFRQGAIWLDLLVAVRNLGGDVEAMRAVVHVLNALAVVTLLLVASWIRSDLAVPSALLATGAILASGLSGQLINTAATPLPDVLCAAAAGLFMARGRLSQLVVASFAAGLAVNLHVSAGAFVPSLLFIAAIGGRRPVGQVLLVVGVLGVTAVSSSSGAWANNVAELRHRHALLPVSLGLVAMGVAGASLRRRFEAVSEAGRLWLSGLVLTGPFALGCLWLTAVEHREVSGQYLHPILGPAAVLAALLLLEPLRRFTRPVVRATLVSGGLLGLVFGEARTLAAAKDPRAWSFEDARSLSAMLGKDWDFDDLVGTVEGPLCRDVVVGLSVYLPASVPERMPRPGLVLRVVPPDSYDPHDSLPSQSRFLRVTGQRDFVVADFRGWLQPAAGVACRAEVGASSPPSCLAVRAATVSPRGDLFSARTDLSRFHLDTSPPFVASFEIPLVPDSAGEHVFELANPDATSCGWRIVAAEGVEVSPSLPATRIQARSRDGRAGHITLQKTFGTPGCQGDTFHARYPPCLMETDGSEQSLRLEHDR